MTDAFQIAAEQLQAEGTWCSPPKRLQLAAKDEENRLPLLPQPAAPPGGSSQPSTLAQENSLLKRLLADVNHNKAAQETARLQQQVQALHHQEARRRATILRRLVAYQDRVTQQETRLAQKKQRLAQLIQRRTQELVAFREATRGRDPSHDVRPGRGRSAALTEEEDDQNDQSDNDDEDESSDDEEYEEMGEAAVEEDVLWKKRFRLF
jgi:hypothetical protein